MFNIKKKINAFIPGDGARGALQNVLTVEWSGHKTVLVDVPQAGTSRTNEVEMSGMGDRRDSYGYGRLSDDDDDEERAYVHRNPSPYDQPRRRTSAYHSDTPPPVPPKPKRSTGDQYERGASQSRELRPSHARLNSNNPFKSAYETDELDFSPDIQTNPRSTYQPQPNSRNLTTDSYRWNTTSGSSKQTGATWTGNSWVNTPGLGQTSPTSSRGTRDSGTVMSEENPFR